MIDDDSEYFLSHHGVKGMKWGVRKKRESSGKQSAPKKRLTPQQRDRIFNVAVGVVVASVAVAGILQKEHQHQTTRSSLNRLGNIDFSSAAMKAGLSKDAGKTKVSDIRPPPAAKKALAEMSPETKNFISQFSAKQSLINRSANADLKDLFNKGQVPLHAREYLSTWEIEL